MSESRVDLSEPVAERGAEAFWYAHKGRPGTTSWSNLSESTKQFCRDRAVAIIEAVAGEIRADAEAELATARAQLAAVAALAEDIERQSRISNVGNTATIVNRLRAVLTDPAAALAAIRAEAWDEGWQAGENFECARWSGSGVTPRPALTIKNPYRADRIEADQ